MDKYFNLYEYIEMIDPAELKRAAGLDDPEKIIWPKGKKYKVQLSGKECTITTSFSGVDRKVNGDLDAYIALSTMMSRDEVVEQIHKEDPNGGTDAEYYATAQFLPGLPRLTDEEIEHRKAFTAAILTLLSDQRTIETLAECAPRKKNGLFHKGRVFKIGLTGFADDYGDQLLEIIGKSKDETSLLISIIKRSTSPEELEAWQKDFVSTYHEGLPLSEALKVILEPIEAEAGRTVNAKKIIPDLFEGLGDGSQEIDTSLFERDVDYLKGVNYKKDQIQRKLDTLKKYLIDPNEIEWDGKGVYIAGDSDNVFRDKLREVGAIPFRSWNKRINYIVKALDFRTFMKRELYGDESSFISQLGYLIDYAKSCDGIIEEREFLKWCLNGHPIKYDLSKDEHLKDYGSNSVSFKKIDPHMFIKQAIKKTNPHGSGREKEIYDGDIFYCVVGAGEQAEKIRNFFQKIGKAVMEQYVEGARWPRLILENPSGKEEMRAYKVAQYNKMCGEKVQVWSADDVVSLIDLYGEGISKVAEKEYYNNETLEQLVHQIMTNAGEAPNVNSAKSAAKHRIESVADIVKRSIIKINSIDCAGKTFVFYGRGTVKGIPFAEFDFDNQVYDMVREKGGVVKENVTGKTDYYVIMPDNEGTWTTYKTKDAAKQLIKRNTLRVVTLENLLEVLDKPMVAQEQKTSANETGDKSAAEIVESSEQNLEYLQKVLDLLKEKYTHEERPTNYGNLEKENPEIDWKEVRYLVVMKYDKTASQFFKDKGFVRKRGGNTEKSGDLTESQHSKEKGTIRKKSENLKKTGEELFFKEEREAKLNRAMKLFISCVDRVEQYMDETGDYNSPCVSSDSSIQGSAESATVDSRYVSDFFDAAVKWMKENSMKYDYDLDLNNIRRWYSDTFKEIIRRGRFWFEGESGVRYPVGLAVAYIVYATPSARIKLEFVRDKWELRGDYSSSKRVCLRLSDYGNDVKVDYNYYDAYDM